MSAYLEKHPEVAIRFSAYNSQRTILHRAFDPIVDEPIPTRLNLNHMIATRRQNRVSTWRLAAAAEACNIED
ncbi:anti-sigma factor RsiW [Rhizobium sp. BK226]|uniref:anti-sigma factor family protein n=1 Tax=Rhizobium TaxID=379 RepID=UPI000BEA7217|nr:MULTISPECIES: hypothetical protein [Rhizobium]MBB4117600.1 anti-sigma factor RsiW [Rhizobium sp. BK226]MBB4255658.1 anti-sigma factor RsiW [Rhizobium sp. BK008]PDS61962.1 hypothetical protein CO653_30195 [Rhizobium anhuiense]